MISLIYLLEKRKRPSLFITLKSISQNLPRRRKVFSSIEKLTCGINQQKCFTKFFEFLMSQGLSQTKLRKKVFVYLAAIPCIIK